MCNGHQWTADTTQAYHDQNTASSTWVIWFGWKSESLPSHSESGNDHNLSLGPGLIRQMELFFPYPYSSKQDKKEDIRQKWRRVYWNINRL